ncbi:glutamate 5-kinase [Candidatus Wirthbacteria bacterium CG2_30_54_11]|uniref:Glutamate 5-kinase n=1 Tax=Candidatus Wirthbacteria bacterium CG2_30_54_11 TaxID=1817892 RepID=A0A1J5IKM0_9BACT|nr:MAG: glutamate 5-kinase [Candidatus Wirthbacteria bacterium CG2_30_54_11]
MSAYKRVVVKIGSSSLVSKAGLIDLPAMARFVQELSQLHAEGLEVVFVSSGAVASGKGKVDLEPRYQASRKQILSAVGQSVLMQKYSQFFSEYGITVAQMLLIREDLEDRQTYLNARTTLQGLLHHRVLPVINENDVVTAGSFGGNDMLAAAIAGLVDADLLVLLTDVPGYYQKYSSDVAPEAYLRELSPEAVEVELGVKRSSSSSGLGTGGITTKLEAMSLAASFGIPSVIAQGKSAGLLKKVLSDEADTGTWCRSVVSRLESRKRWLRYGSKPVGEIKVDDGAEQALLHHGTSLLPIGVVQVNGTFERGDLVSIVSGSTEAVIALGLVNCSSDIARLIQGKKSADIKQTVGSFSLEELVHRDNLVLV